MQNGKSSRSLEEIDKILNLAKLSHDDLLPTNQVLYFASENLHDNNYKFLELDDHLQQTLTKGASVHIKGDADDYAVLCTDSRTYDVVEAETSNTLLLVNNLQFKDQINKEGDRAVSKVIVSGLLHNYLEVKPRKAHFYRLKELLSKAVYKGPELEDQINESHLVNYDDLLNNVQASKQELDKALEEMHVVEIDGKIRLLDFEYHFRILSYMLKLIDENSWELDAIDYDETMNALSDLAPYSILNTLFDLYTEQSKIIDGLQLYRYKAADICTFFAQVLLCSTGKFNLNEFLQAWKDSVPEGMEPNLDMLHGIAVVDTKPTPNIIKAFPEDNLPDNIVERLKALFDVKEKWTIPEISPYIRRLTTEKADVSALLAKYSRASTVNGVKYYCAKHTK